MGHWLLFQQPRYLSEPRRAGEQGVEVGSAPSVKRRVREAERARHRIFLSFPHTFQIGRAGTKRVPRRHRTPGRRAKEWQPPAVPSLDLVQRNSAGPIVLSRRAPSPLSVLHRNPIASCSDLFLSRAWLGSSWVTFQISPFRFWIGRASFPFPEMLLWSLFPRSAASTL